MSLSFHSMIPPENILNLANTAAHHLFVFLVVISVLVFIHEMGHYLAAKYCKVKVEVFSVGFGKAIFSRKDSSGTEWRISWIPIGGYVKMLGEDEDLDSPGVDLSNSLENKSPIQKIIVAFAGPAANFIISFLISVVLIYLSPPFASPPIIASFTSDNSPALLAGMHVGDEIISIDGKKVADIQDVKSAIILKNGLPITVVYKRSNSIETINVVVGEQIFTDSLGKTMKGGMLGIVSPPREQIDLDIFQVFTIAAKKNKDITINAFRAVFQIVSGKRSPKEMGGPVHMAGSMGKAAESGTQAILWMTVAISLNLGAFNLIPLPGLDGSHIVFASIEPMFDRKKFRKAKKFFFRFGFMLLIGLMFFVTIGDVKHFVLRKS